MPTIHDISTYLQQGTRNRIVFCKDYIHDIVYINVGRELAKLIDTSQDNVVSLETMYKLILKKTQNDSGIGSYLAIENIGILFEPELKIDFRSILSNYSKNQCLIIKADALIENDILYFLDVTDDTRIRMQGLSYKQI